MELLHPTESPLAVVTDDALHVFDGMATAGFSLDVELSSTFMFTEVEMGGGSEKRKFSISS